MLKAHITSYHNHSCNVPFAFNCPYLSNLPIPYLNPIPYNAVGSSHFDYFLLLKVLSNLYNYYIFRLLFGHPYIVNAICEIIFEIEYHPPKTLL
jgi:hypothetical protein